jgi:peptidoglycan hydrolase-like protein with peptidoglycan-binding domain
MEGCGSTARQPASAATPSAYRAAAPRARAASSHVATEPRTCRFVATQTQIDGREQSRDVVACLGPDGTWRPDSSAPAQQAAQADLVVRAQQRLRQDGFYVRDNIDGQWGPATSAAVSNFQRANGLPSSGQLDLSTRAAMGLDAAPVAASPVVPTSNAGQVGAPSLQTTQVRQAQ